MRSAMQKPFPTPWAVLVGLACLGPPSLLPGQQGSAASTDIGRKLFETTCVACHTIGGGVLIGPDLKGVAERRDPEWLRRFILDPERMFSAGDSVALALLAQYSVRMPSFGLTDQQVGAVIEHLSATEAAPASRPALFLPTLLLSALVAVGITVAALNAATKRVETA